MSCKGISLKHGFCLFAFFGGFGGGLAIIQVRIWFQMLDALGEYHLAPSRSTLLPISHGQRLALIVLSMESTHDGNKGLPRKGKFSKCCNSAH
jgi:hypothetical protein